jgi:hypothetical protein
MYDVYTHTRTLFVVQYGKKDKPLEGKFIPEMSKPEINCFLLKINHLTNSYMSEIMMMSAVY